MKIDASIILDAKYDQRLMKYVCCELLGIQLRSLTFTQDLLFLEAKTVRLVMADSYAGFTGYVLTEAVSGKKKLLVQKYPDTCGLGLKLSNLSAAGRDLRMLALFRSRWCAHYDR